MIPEESKRADAESVRPLRVFVTYSHDSTGHKALVREFCTLLRRDAGFDVRLDQWDDDGRRDWSAWAMEQIREADFILVIPSPAYCRRAEGLGPSGEGRGARFEAMMLRNLMTQDIVEQTRRIIPVVLPGGSVDEIPAFLCPYSATHYVVDELTLDGVQELLAALNNVARYPKPERGRFVGNPFAELHAKLQADENKLPPPPTVRNNRGVVNYGSYQQTGDVFAGNKIINNSGQQ